MKSALACLAAISLCCPALAATNHAQYSYQTRFFVDSPPGSYPRGGSGSDSDVDMSPARIDFISPPNETSSFGMTVLARSTALANRVHSDLSALWYMPQMSGFTSRSLEAGTSASTADEVGQDTAGRVRFTFAYDLYARGTSISSGLVFSARNAAGESIGFDLDLDSTEEGVARQGVHTTEWLYFDAASGGIESFSYQLLAPTYINTLTRNDLSVPGDEQAFSHVGLSLEVAPIPEPEVYGLLGAGLATIALRRARSGGRRNGRV